MANDLKRGDKVKWAAKFTRGKDPGYGLANERMIITRKNPNWTHPYELRVVSPFNKGIVKMASRNELVKIS